MKLKNAIIVIGPPGSGKGTQADLLAASTGFLHFGMGQLIRDYIKAHPEDKEVADRYDAGIIQPDDFIYRLFKDNFAKLAAEYEGIITDDFPLSINQAEFFEEIFMSHGIKPHAIYIDVPDEEITKRLSSRKICVGCRFPHPPGEENYNLNECTKCGGHMEVRTDDKPEVVKHRLMEYAKRMGPLKDYFSKKHQLTIVDGHKTVNEVQGQITKALSV
jgi:adenylate kinase